MKNEFYLVISTFYNDGRIKAVIHTEPHDKKPENHSSSNDDYDLYYDWYDTYDEALTAKKDAIKESN